jgi:hypothetical protein
MSRWTPVIPQARRAAYERSQFAPAVVAGGLIHVSKPSSPMCSMV